MILTPTQKVTLFRDLFPYRRRFLDKRISSYYSLLCEVDVYYLEKFASDILEVLHPAFPKSFKPWPDDKPVVQEFNFIQLTFF